MSEDRPINPLIAARHERSLMQKQLADLTGINRRTLRRYETGVFLPRPVHLRVLAEALGMDGEQLHAALLGWRALDEGRNE